jgi:acetate kinase
MNILALNPGGNSLKAEFVQCRVGQQYAYEGKPLLRVSIEGIGKKAELSILHGKEKTTTEPIVAENYEQATADFLRWWDNRSRHGQLPDSFSADVMALGVVHGGRDFTKATPIDAYVVEKIIEFEKLAPLHNKSSSLN